VTVLLCLALAASAPGEPVADSLLRNGLCASAATEYLRALFLVPDRPGLTRLKLGLSLGLSGETETGLEHLRRAGEEHPEFEYAAALARAGFLLSSSGPALARLELLDLALFVHDSAPLSRLNAALAWLELEELNFAEAARRLELAAHPDAAAKVREAGTVRGRNPTVAVLLSSLVPGTGEIYAGRPAAGLMGLAATGGSAAAAYFAARSDDWVSAAVIFSFLFLRFYNGSRSNAADFCHEYRDATLRRRSGEIAARYGLEPDWFAPAESLIGFALPPATGAGSSSE